MITLEVTNTLDTTIIDEGDGLSLGEAIQIANNDPENSYLIEIPSGSYNVTLTEDFDLVGKITIVSKDDEGTVLDFSRSGERVARYDVSGRIQISLDVVFRNSNNNNPVNNDSNNTNALTLNGETAQLAYVAYYGRPADVGGLTFWNEALSNSQVSYAPRKGDLLTGSERDIYNDIVDDFGNSVEAERLFGELNNREKVDLVYQFAFDREADFEGANYWTEQIDDGNVTLANFALEVVLGAQGEDIVTLNNKIESANLFSENINTQEEINAYSGSAGEVFGREWLDGFGSTTSSQEQVDLTLGDLVNGEL